MLQGHQLGLWHLSSNDMYYRDNELVAPKQLLKGFHSTDNCTEVLMDYLKDGEERKEGRLIRHIHHQQLKY